MSRETLLSRFKQQLLQIRAGLMGVSESAEQAAATVELDQACVGRLSRMDAMQQQAMAQATGQRRVVQLKKIEAALLRIKADEFGYCLACDEEISEGRLRVDPMATLCIACAEVAEG